MIPLPRHPYALKYLGTKWKHAPEIISLFPPHHTYVEPFGGMMQVLFQKPRSPVELYSDLEHQNVNLFTQLRDHTDELLHYLAAPPNEHLWRFFRRHVYGFYASELEWAARYYISLNCSKWGTLPRLGSGYSAVLKWNERVESLRLYAERLQGVEILHRDGFELIEQHGQREDVLLYLDPPYHRAARRRHESEYVVDWTAEDHQRLVRLLLGIRARVVLSGYPNADYEQLRGWRQVVLSYERPANRFLTEAKVKETVWLNY